MLGKAKRGSLTPRVRILELGCKRPEEISQNLCVNVRGSKCKSKSYVNRDLDNPLEIALGVVEPARAQYMDVIHDMD